MTEGIEIRSRYTPVAGLEITQVPDGTMIYQKSRERVHYLNPTATIVFELCGMGKSVAEIQQFVFDAFSLPTVPADEVSACIALLAKEELLLMN